MTEKVMVKSPVILESIVNTQNFIENNVLIIKKAKNPVFLNSCTSKFGPKLIGDQTFKTDTFCNGCGNFGPST